MQKQAYHDQEQGLRSKWRDLNTRIASILNQYWGFS